MSWPSMSPDLNPIENLWAIMKHKIEKMNPDNINDMIKGINNVWNGISVELRESLVESMPTRIKLCLKAKGDKIPY